MKNQQYGFGPGSTQIGLYSHRRWLKAGNFGFKKKKNCTIHVVKTKALISFAVTAKLICAFVFGYADCWFAQRPSGRAKDTRLSGQGLNPTCADANRSQESGGSISQHD